jgi:hypothetical protein
MPLSKRRFVRIASAILLTLTFVSLGVSTTIDCHKNSHANEIGSNHYSNLNTNSDPVSGLHRDSVLTDTCFGIVLFILFIGRKYLLSTKRPRFKSKKFVVLNFRESVTLVPARVFALTMPELGVSRT